MKCIAVLLVALSVCSGSEANPALDAECQEWVTNNQKDMIILNQVASASSIGSCQQYCMIAASGLRSDTASCRSLCERAGGYEAFSSALKLDEGKASPSEICKSLATAAVGEEESTSVVETGAASLLEVDQSQSVSERKLGVRGDMTVQGTLVTSMLTSPIGDVKVSGELNVLNSIESSSATAGLLKADSVSVRQGIVSKKDQLLIKGKIDADSVTADTLQASSFLEIGGVRQWALHSLEDFEEEADTAAVVSAGWSHGDVTDCGGHKILGGHCIQRGVGDPISKKVSNLPPHTQLRVVAKYMFIDSWDGESGFMKVDDNTVWTETYNHADGDAKHGINICGDPAVAERKLSRSIDITVPHSASDATLAFGATTDEHPCDESFGIDSVMIFVR